MSITTNTRSNTQSARKAYTQNTSKKDDRLPLNTKPRLNVFQGQHSCRTVVSFASHTHHAFLRLVRISAVFIRDSFCLV